MRSRSIGFLSSIGLVGVMGAPLTQVSAQNTNPPGATTSIVANQNSYCGQTLVGATTASALSATDCTDITVPGDALSTMTANALVTPTSEVSALASYSGTPGSNNSTASAYGYYVEFVTVTADPNTLNPTAIYQLELNSTVNGALSADASTNAVGLAELDADDTDLDQIGTAATTSAVSNGSLGVTVNWADVADAGNTFAYELYVSAAVAAGPNAPFLDPDANSNFSLLDPSITLLDADGNNITSQYDLSYDPAPVTATPEPASLTLFGTGLFGLAGVTWRRRRATGAV